MTPVPGTTAMTGSKLITADAAEFYLFSAYRLRFLPRSLDSVPDEVTVPSDPMADQLGRAGDDPAPGAGRQGRVLRRRPAAGDPRRGQGALPVGAVRPGMRERSGALAPWAVGGCRPYRVAWAKDGWEEPQSGGTARPRRRTARARLTWVNDDETACLVEVTLADGTRQLLAGQRADAKAPWGKLEKLDVPGGPSIGDGQRFGRQLKALVWTVYDATGSDLWLSTEGKPGQMLEPRINTMGPEWAPRVGPNNSLYFCRADRQLLFWRGRRPGGPASGRPAAAAA